MLTITLPPYITETALSDAMGVFELDGYEWVRCCAVADGYVMEYQKAV